MATKSAFIPQLLGITAFMASNRIDFVLDGPNRETPARTSAFYDNPKAKLHLDGKLLKIVAVHTDKVSDEPNQLEIRLGGERIVLGRRKDAAGPVSFYRSMEAGNNADAPKTAKEILSALRLFTK